MSTISRLLNKLRYLLRGRRIDKDLAQELDFHREMLARDEESLGHDRATALLNARRRMGNTALMRDYSRDAWIVAWFDSLVRDVRHALRSFRRSPSFTITALLTITLGIGANATIFAIVNGVLLRPLPYADPDRLVMVWSAGDAKRGGRLSAMTEGDAFDIREASRTLEHFEAFQANLVPLTMRVRDVGVSAQAVSVTPGTFTLLGRNALLGRTLVDGDRFAIVLSYAYWQRQFGGDSQIVGAQAMVGTTPATIVGVMPRDFAYPYRSMLLASVSFGRPADADVWVPMTLQNRRPNDSLRLIGALARLRDGVTAAQANDDVNAIARRLAAEHPSTNGGWGATAVGVQQQVTATVRPTLLLLLAGVGLVTLMACANVANLLLARSLRRRREMAIRSAIGAARGRLLRQTMTESAVLSMIGAAVAWIAIDWLTRAFVAVAPGEIPRLAELDRDWRVAVYTFALALLTAVVAGWLPAISASRADLSASLGEASRGSTSGRGNRIRSTLVATQVALAVILAFGTGLLVRSFISVVGVDPGFQTENVLTMQVAVPRSYDTPDKRRAFYGALFARLEAVPGISAVGGTTRLPLGGANSTTRAIVEGRDPGSGVDVGLRRAMKDYFDVMRIPVLRGRAFTSADGPQAPKVVVINHTMAARVFPGEDPIGRRVTLAENAGIGTATIVGIVGDVRHDGLEAAPSAEVYIHYLQNPPSGPLLVMRTGPDPASLSAAVRAAVHDVDPAILAYDIRPMAVLRSQAMIERRFITVAATMFGALAIALAMVGVYGVMALAVGERTKEIGIRLALGAEPRAVLAMIVRQGVAVAAAGTVCGLAVALALAPAIGAQLYGVRPADLVTLVSVAALLLGAAAAASIVPARRAMRVDPAATLR